MKRHRRKLLFFFAFLLLLVGLPAWWLHREIQQERLNASLIAAIKDNDTTAAIQALERGADANARDLGDVKPSIGERFHQLWDRLRGSKVPDQHSVRPAAILVFFQMYQLGDRLSGLPENVPLLKSLLDHGANPRVVNKDGRTPLHYAAECHLEAATVLLLQRGVALNVRDASQCTPLHLATNYSQEVRLLLDAGADPNVADRSGNTPLHNVATSGRAEAADLLIRKGADINARTLFGLTPLHCTVFNDHLETPRCLLEHGADVQAQDNQGDTPLSLVRQQHNFVVDYDQALIRLLKQHGAK